MVIGKLYLIIFNLPIIKIKQNYYKRKNISWSTFEDFICQNKLFLIFRFWWEAEGMFTQQQKTELLKASLSRIICDNSDIKEVHPDSFRFSKYPCGYISCDHIPSIDLEAWRQEKSQGGLEKLLC